MKQLVSRIVALFLLVTLSQSCSINVPNLVGQDKDSHGCIGSAGYSWCGQAKQCERQWELAAKYNFENTTEGFETYCSKTGSAN